MIPDRKPDQHYPFTAREVTARDLANLCKPRAAQDVHVCSRTVGNGRWRAVVLVTPEGAEHGEYYELFNRATLDALEAGRTPAELELEPFEGDEDEPSTADIPSPEELRRSHLSRVL